MEKFESYCNVIFTVLATSLTILFGGWDIALKVLITFIVLDYITGVASAFCGKKVSSRTGAKGIVKKIMILLMIVMASQLDKLANTQQLIRTTVIYFYVANEGISILENIANLGIPLPKIIKEKLLQINGGGD